jgi:hypothetical protein
MQYRSLAKNSKVRYGSSKNSSKKSSKNTTKEESLIEDKPKPPPLPKREEFRSAIPQLIVEPKDNRQAPTVSLLEQAEMSVAYKAQGLDAETLQYEAYLRKTLEDLHSKQLNEL